METLNWLRRLGLLSGMRGLVTPSGGLHLYFTGSAHPKSKLSGRCIDFPAPGAYVVVPPSYLATETYAGRYLRSLPLRPEGGILSWPSVMAAMRPGQGPTPQVAHISRAAGVACSPLASWLLRQPPGRRNKCLHWACCEALRCGRTDLTEMINIGVVIGLPIAEVQRTAASARRTVGVR